MERDPFSKNSLTKEQKTGFVLLLIFGILAIGLGLLQMRNTIYGPFVIRLSDKTDTANQEASLLNDEARLQSIDTDRDGLNDFEELNFYETSPYLADTDSDGLNDKVEIEKGGNPLCPEGEACETNETVVPAATTTLDFVSPLVNLEVPTDTGLESLADLQKVLNDPKQIRQLFLSTGKISADDLSKISDAELMKMVDEIVAENGGVPQ
ncbi:MAG: hypothetical protein HY569_01170 [Candidatus Magasanikbacteria bacterium]|nr:hypothetical protein [Candidatus Magasanikbacteria bacterium]